VNNTMLMLTIIWLLALGAGGAYYGHRRWGYGGGAGIGIGTILLILLAVNVLAFTTEARTPRANV